MWSSEIKKQNLNWIYKRIMETTIQDKTVSIKKLRGLAAIELGISNNKFDEYMNDLASAGKIKLDNDDAFAIDESGDIYKKKNITKEIKEEIENDLKKAGLK